jgi:hypothetical protein
MGDSPLPIQEMMISTGAIGEVPFPRNLDEMINIYNG